MDWISVEGLRSPKAERARNRLKPRILIANLGHNCRFRWKSCSIYRLTGELLKTKRNSTLQTRSVVYTWSILFERRRRDLPFGRSYLPGLPRKFIDLRSGCGEWRRCGPSSIDRWWFRSVRRRRVIHVGVYRAGERAGEWRKERKEISWFGFWRTKSTVNQIRRSPVVALSKFAILIRISLPSRACRRSLHINCKCISPAHWLGKYLDFQHTALSIHKSF